MLWTVIYIVYSAVLLVLLVVAIRDRRRKRMLRLTQVDETLAQVGRLALELNRVKKILKK